MSNADRRYYIINHINWYIISVCVSLLIHQMSPVSKVIVVEVTKVWFSQNGKKIIWLNTINVL